MSGDGERPGREVAYRLFAAEYDDATLSHAESDEERAPNYVITPTGARVNRLFAVGTLTEVSPVNEEMVRARVVDPTGAFVVYAGQYQPDALAFLERAEPPAFVSVTGKARTFQPEDSDRVYTSVRPESLATVDADTRDRWVVSTAEQTLDRIATYAAAAGLDARGEELTAALRENGVSEGLARGIPLAQGHYETTPDYLEGLRSLSLDAVRVVANERDEVVRFDLGPSESGTESASFDDLAETAFEERVDETAEPAAEPATADESEADAESADRSATATAEAGDASVAETAGPDTELAGGTETDADGDESGAEAGTDAAETAEPTVESTGDIAADGADEATASFDEGDVDESDGDGVDESDSVDVDESDGDDSDEDDLGDFESGGLGDEMYEMDEEERQEIEEEFGAEFTTGSEVDEPGEADIDVSERNEREAESADEEAEPTVRKTDASADESDVAGDADVEPEEPESAASESEPAEPEPASEPAESEPDEAAAESDADAVGTESGTDAVETDESGDRADESAEDIDLQSSVVDAMRDLDDGDGADREAVIETVVEETGADAEDVEEAIQDALMGGQCYEPDDETLKAI